MKVLTGIYQKDAGSIRYKGQEVDIPNPRRGSGPGHQHGPPGARSGPAPHRRPEHLHGSRAARPRLVRRRREAPGGADRRAHRPAALAARPARQGRATSRSPSSRWSRSPRRSRSTPPCSSWTSPRLPSRTRRSTSSSASSAPSRRAGVGIVHISHRLEELRQISDRVTVMRDGRHVATVETAAVSIDEIISMMVGRTIYEEAPQLPEQPIRRSCSRSAACHAAAPFGTSPSSCVAARSWAWPGSWAPAAPELASPHLRCGPQGLRRGPRQRPHGRHRQPGDGGRLRHQLPVRGPQAARPGPGPGRRDERGHGLLPALPSRPGPGQYQAHSLRG